MAFEIPKQPYSGNIGETTLGTGDTAITLGGEDSYPFHVFEGTMPNPPRIAMEVWDYDPSQEWPKAAVEPFKDVISSPDLWAKKCVEDYGADMVVLQLKSTDPNGMDRSAAEAAQVARKVLDAIDVPLVVWGTANNRKDEDVLKKISESCEGTNVTLSPVEEANHKGIGAAALGYGHSIVASSPIDVNLAKQLNILLGNLGVAAKKIIVDPTTGGLGYGLEYTYSVMERIRMAALTQEDDKLQVPMINNVGNEVWKCKEAGQTLQDAPTTGNPEKRAILMEAVAAGAYLMAGSDVVVLRHPETVRLVRSFIDLMINGGSAAGVGALVTRLDRGDVDLAALSPEPNLDFGAPEPAPVKKQAAPPKKAAAPAPEKAKEPPAAKAEVKAEAEAEAKAEAGAAAKAEAEAKAQADAKAKAEAEAAVKAEAKAKAEADAAARAQADAEAKAKAEADAKAKADAEAKARERDDLQALRLKRATEKEKREAERVSAAQATAKTPAKEQRDLVDRLIDNLDRIHRWR